MKASRAARKRTSRDRQSSTGSSGTPAVTDTVVVPFTMTDDAAAMPANSAALLADSQIVLERDCTARCAQDLRSSLLAQLEANTVNVDAAAVERIDTVCLQLLAAFVRDRQRAGRQVSWRGHGDVLFQSAELLGLTGVLAIDVGS